MRLQDGELIITASVEARLQELGYTPEELQEAIAFHKSECYGEPSVYVGTYAKYNEGSLYGMWIDISSFNDYDECINFCMAIHADEEDPELMAEDFAAFPDAWYNEGFISEEDFDNILEYSDMCDKHGADAVNDYLEFHDTLDSFEEAYCGTWDDEEDFARHIIGECYNLESELGDLARYFDYEAFGRDLFMYDYELGENGSVFRVI